MSDEQVTGVLAIDAGNSKTDVALVGLDGRVLGREVGGGFTPRDSGDVAALAALAPLIRSVATQAGLCADPDRPLATHVSACLANADLPVVEQRFERELAGFGWGLTTTVANDTFAVLRCGTSTGKGVAVVCGAGLNCVGLRPDGQTVRFLASGRVSGDWGGGAELAEMVMYASVRAEDGRGPATILAAATATHFGQPSASRVAELLYLNEIPESRLHELVPVLFAAAADRDEVAIDLVTRQAEEIAAMSLIALRRLDLLDERVPVVLGGGVLAARQPLLLDVLRSRLAEQAPKASAEVTITRPVAGAALLGLDLLAERGHQVEPGAEARLHGLRHLHRLPLSASPRKDPR